MNSSWLKKLLTRDAVDYRVIIASAFYMMGLFIVYS